MMLLLLRLFYEFFKTGLFAIGGGLATLPFLQAMSESTGWFTSAQLADMIAVSESTPGPIGVNMASFVGFTVAGIPGAIIATVGLITPSVIIVLIIAAFLKAFKDNRFVKSAFYGLRPASTGLIAAAGFSVVMISLINVDAFKLSGDLAELFNIKGLILAAVLSVFLFFVKPTKKLHPIIYIALSAVAGIVFAF